ncbi:unnamed protein product [Zymoseptoria tritici ST99CH_3D1]|uniref:Uncharacterized protein n=2 Tax=Zymoseptoria tritici TaxID=1047171 RepID=A0A1X7S083_ZYMT9|nr:unnamed protein product [Zymoseptoria tritici ST99CH_3D7]SMR56658.1 unnamed protein product [Zymoseptoria tritici ST99CH_1E4]SMR59510.1 unnamed protein product [Zymoseptoria tritici ST99CH_3D1]
MLAIKTAVILSLVAATAHAVTVYGTCTTYKTSVSNSVDLQNYWGTCDAAIGDGGAASRACKKTNQCNSDNAGCSFDPDIDGSNPNNDAACA